MELRYDLERDRRKRKITGYIFIFLFILSLILSCGCLDATSQASQPVDNRTGMDMAPSASAGPATSESNPVHAQPVNGIHPSTGREIEVITSDGTAVRLPSTVNRIIAANGDAAELLIALGAEGKIVGVTDSVASDSVLNPYIANARSIGNWQTPDIEAMLELHPDIVITYGSYRPKNIDRILAMNVSVLSIDCYHLDSLSRDIQSLAVLTGRESEAIPLIAFIERSKEITRERVGGIDQRTKPRVFIESYTEYTVSGKGSAADTLITFAGGINIAGNDSQPSFKVNPEWIVTQNPDVIIKLVPGNKPWEEYPKIKEILLNRPGFANVSAVQNNRIYLLNGEYAFGPRVSAGILAIGKILYPERFEDIDPNELVSEYRRKFLDTVPEGQMLFH